MKHIKFLFIASILFAFSSFVVGDWIVFLSHDGKFKVSFPHEPEVLKHVVDKGIIPVKSRLVKYDVGKFKDDNQCYQLIYSDYPDSLISSDFKTKITDTFLKNMIYTTRDELKGRVISIENTNFNNYPGRHIHLIYNSGKNAINMKMFLIKSRLYILKVECTPGNDNNQSIDKFFDSFELIEADAKIDKSKKK